MKYTPAQIEAVKAAHSVADYAAGFVRLRHRPRRSGFTHAGPCPVCSRDVARKDTARFECNDEAWVCAACCSGGDIIRLCMLTEGVDFDGAMVRLGADKTAPEETPASAYKAGRRAWRAGQAIEHCPHGQEKSDLRGAWLKGFYAARDADAASARYREAERRRLYEFLKTARPFAGTPVQAYLTARGLRAPPGARLYYHPATPLFGDKPDADGNPVLIHTGPAMLAPMLRADGKFCALHYTYLDPALADMPSPANSRVAKGKLFAFDPTIGEHAPAKKIRGSKQGGAIPLGGLQHTAPLRLIAGEGIETVLAVYTAQYIADGSEPCGTLYRAAADLGNLAGKAVESVAHPEWKDKGGRPRRVPGAEPDMNSPAMPVPACVNELILLGDGDSDPFLTRLALARANARHARPGLIIRTAMADAGCDFNDMLLAQTKEAA